MEDLIIKYFEGTLSQQEKDVFNEKLEKDDAFRADFEFQQSVQSAIRNKERTALKETISGFEKPKTKNTWWRYAAAAVLAMVLGGGIYAFINSTKAPDELYLTYYQTYPNVVAPNVRGENEQNLKNKAFKAYDSGDYAEALLLFNQINGVEYADFYKGISMLELGQTTQTIAHFKNLKFSESPYPFETYRKWYLALAYLQKNQIKEAKILLKQLSETVNPQRQKAAELLEDL